MDEIAAIPKPNHLFTKRPGVPVYSNLSDRLFHAPGSWNFYRSPDPKLDVVWLNPMPAQEELWKAYKDYYTHEPASPPQTFKKRLIRDLKQAVVNREFGYQLEVAGWIKFLSFGLYLDPDRIAEVRHSVMHLPAKPGGKLLEIGSGNGERLQFMRQLGWQVEGLDIDPGAAEVASRSGVKVHVGSLLTAALPQNTYDAVILSHVFEHLPDPEEHLNKIRELLKPGGRLVLVTPNSEGFGHKLFKQHWIGLDPPRHLYIYSQRSLEKAVRDAGFHLERGFTSIRHGVGNYASSYAIRKTGSFRWGERHPLQLRLGFKVLQYAVAALNLVLGNLGEEVCIVARKPAP